MFTTLFQQLPEVYQSFLPAIFGKNIAVESYADCSNCNMCQPNDHVTDQRFFSSKTKCCTFKPIVPNYLVGGLINDKSMNSKINGYVESSHPKMQPLGYFPSHQELALYSSILPDNFGIDETAACELLDNGNCSIWKYRNSMCSTYFCHYFKGSYGKLFWVDVRDFLQIIEELITHFICKELGISSNYLSDHTTNFYTNVQSSLENEDPASSINQSTVWGKWTDKRFEFYTECYKIAQSFTEADIRQINTPLYDEKLAALNTSYDNMLSESVPSTLTFNPKCKIIDYDSTTCFFYISRLIKLPIIMTSIIKEFDGSKTVDHLLSIIPEKYNVDIDMAYIRHLHEQDILINV